MCLACLFDLFCPLLETVVCLFIWGEGGIADLGVTLFFGFILVLFLTIAVKVLLTTIMTTKQFSLLEDEFYWIISDFS